MEASKLSVPSSQHMIALLNKSHVCKSIARAAPDIKEVLLQIQLDISNEKNKDTIGPTIVALKNIHDILLLFVAKGELILSKEKESDNKK